ncbi:ImmA/IrrE family metallo-endopeptidase [Paraliobacillus sp. X-1268]|uniref:ImmA/IrrE family metallo-endopeptidase n=1 Tax=Paraliobacillus sp. X-1268 TaxID=2213193 RepID=UPI000E3CAF35|nr:ImmA/IrrE family metallo-endopeptidase [Paraliobacillus sp. X-1268]
MYLYETLMEECNGKDIEVYEKKMKNKGLYGDNIIWINKSLPTSTEKYSILAEELGHYYTSIGDITDQSKLVNRKHEKRARAWAFEKAVPFKKIVQAHKESVKNKYELAKFLGVTESFLEGALDRYKEKYGDTVDYENYTVCFEPLGVIEWFDKNF